MKEVIPTKVARGIIANILIERSNKIDKACRELMEQDLKENNAVSEYSQSIGWEACALRVLADDILAGEISIKEAIKDILDPDEIQEAKARCEEWIKESQKDETER